jgi:hypothetical protein
MATSTLGSGTLVLAGTTSGTTTVTATAVAGTTTLTLPAATDTLVGKATTDTLTNKTLTGAAMNGTLGATTPSTVAATTLTTSSTVTHNGGTANGVPYLDGSKVLTTGTALVFDGSNLGVGTTSPGRKFVVSLAGAQGLEFGAGVGESSGNELLNYNRSTSAYIPFTALSSTYTFYTGTSGSTRAVDIDSSGNLLAGRTSVGTATSGSTIRFGASGQGIATTVYGFPITNTSYKDIAITTGGGDWNCLLLVSVSNGSNGNIATRTTYVVLGRGTTATFTSLATQNGSSGGASFTATCPSNGVMRITNTSGADVEITATVFGHGG